MIGHVAAILNVSEWIPTANALSEVAISALTAGAVNGFSLSGLANVSTELVYDVAVAFRWPAGDNYVQFAAFEDTNSPPPQLVLNWTTG